jgi:hypothetical protein
VLTLILRRMRAETDVNTTRRYLTVEEGHARYGGKPSAWRRWILNGALGDAVVRFGRLVRVDAWKLDHRLQETGQLLSRSKISE